MPLATSTGIFSWFTSLFKSRDPLKNEISQSLGIVDRMLRNLEVSKRSLEGIIEDHKKRLNLHQDDPEMRKILEEELNNLRGYISVVQKAIYDLVRVKYRLETLFHVEEPLKELPAIIEELRSIEPLIEQINPQLINNIKLLEQKVASIMAMSSPMPSVIGYTASMQRDGSPRETIQVRKVEPEVSRVRQQESGPPTKKIEHTESSITSEVTQIQRQEKHPIAQPAQRQVDTRGEALATHAITQQTRESTKTGTPVSDVPLHIVEEWLMQELKLNNAVLDLKLFETKYGVSRDVVLEALRSLEAKGLIRIRRKT